MQQTTPGQCDHDAVLTRAEIPTKGITAGDQNAFAGEGAKGEEV